MGFLVTIGALRQHIASLHEGVHVVVVTEDEELEKLLKGRTLEVKRFQPSYNSVFKIEVGLDISSSRTRTRPSKKKRPLRK